jgi:hypothetical protein
MREKRKKETRVGLLDYSRATRYSERDTDRFQRANLNNDSENVLSVARDLAPDDARHPGRKVLLGAIAQVRICWVGDINNEKERRRSHLRSLLFRSVMIFLRTWSLEANNATDFHTNHFERYADRRIEAQRVKWI